MAHVYILFSKINKNWSQGDHGEFSNYHLCPSKLIWRMFIYYFSKIQNVPKVIMVLSDTFSDLDKLIYDYLSKTN